MHEVDHGHQRCGAAEAPCPGDQGVDLGVQRLGPAVRGAAVQGVIDEVPVLAEGSRELGELGDPAAVRPGDHAAQQLLAVLSFDLECLAELFLDQIPLVQLLVVGGDGGQGGALVPVQLLRCLPQRPHAGAEGGGLIVTPGGAQLAREAAAQLIEPFPGPLHDMERVEAKLCLRCLLPDHVVDPVRPVRGHVRQQLAPLRPQGVEERAHGGLAAALADPRDLAAVMIGDDDQVLVLALAPGLLVDPDPAQPVQPVQPGRGVRRDPRGDARQRLPGDPQLRCRAGPRHVRRLPRRELLERPAEPVIMPRPRHRRGDLAVLAADDPRQLRLQERPLAVHVQGPPPHHIVLDGPAALPAFRTAVPCLLVRLDHDDQHLLRSPFLARPALNIRPDHDRVPGVEHLIPHRPCQRSAPCRSRTVTFRHGTLPGHELPALDRHAAETRNNPKPESRGEPEEKRSTYHSMLSALTGQTDDDVVSALVNGITQLTQTAKDKRYARERLLGLLTGQAQNWVALETDSYVAFELVNGVLQLATTGGDRQQTRERLFQLLPGQTSGWVAIWLINGLLRLDLTVEDKKEARAAILWFLADQSDGEVAGQLATEMALLEPTADDKQQARTALLRLLPSQADAWSAGELTRAVITLATTTDDKRQARTALLGLLAGQIESESAGEIAVGIAQLDPTTDDKRQAREVLLDLLASDIDKQSAVSLMNDLARLDPVAQDLTSWRVWTRPPTVELP